MTPHGLQYILSRQIDKFENLYYLLKYIAEIQDDILVRSIIIIRSTEKFLSSSDINTDKRDFCKLNGVSRIFLDFSKFFQYKKFFFQ